MTKNIVQTDLFDLFSIEDEAVETVEMDDVLKDPKEETVPTSDLTVSETSLSAEEANANITEKSREDIKDEKPVNQQKGKILSSFEDDKKEEKKETPKPPAAKKEIGDTFELKVDTIINYAGQEVPVTRYFSEEEITNGIEKKQKGETIQAKVEEKDLLKKLNHDFAELIPQLTSLVFFEKKNMVVPVLQARKKGLSIEKKESSTEDSFSSPKRIPFRLLSDFISIAKKYSDDHQTEIHADIYYDYDLDDFFMDFPKQEVHTYWANRTEDAVETAMKFIDKRYRKVMEIHSHHVMAAFPSSTDNANERSSIFYAIVGKVDDFFPSVTVRRFDTKKQKHIPMTPWQVFEYPFNKTNTKYDLTGVIVSSSN